jgi:ribosomal protection tetracycline resistance protein
MSTVNLGVLAHVDAGRTSLTEWLLHAVGAIDKIGSVDEGSTKTDSLAARVAVSRSAKGSLR